MNTWLPSWLSGLPSLNFTVPVSLQGKFISFALKKSLGHFLKPGQLDSHQIDSQIGSGFVQINELELDNEAINVFLSDLPIEIHDGYIASVTARIPWPNPLTSSLGFSLRSLHLTFYLRPSAKRTQADVNLADSMASMAESFIQEELSPREARLWDSVHADSGGLTKPDMEVKVPGGLEGDPFLSNPEDEFSMDTDPTGVSVFAMLIEHLLSRFEFDAINTKITIVHPGNMSITATIPEIRYYTESGEGDISSRPCRVASISGITVTTRNLRPNPAPAPGRPFHSSSDTASQASPSSSCSDMDEETQLAMSQSIVALPPRMSTSSSSMASSMYQSAISTSPPLSQDRVYMERGNNRIFSPEPQIPDDQVAETRAKDPVEEIIENHEILSFGSSPIMFELTNNTGRDQKDVTDKFQLSITSGVIAIALSPWHVRGLLEVLDVLSYNKAPGRKSSPRVSQGFDLSMSLNIRGVVFLLLLPSSLKNGFGRDLSTIMTEYFKRPFAPPPLPLGYYRLHIDGISGSLTSLDGSPRNRNYGSTFPNRSSGTLTVTDISLFSAYQGHGASTPAAPFPLILSPILLTDRDLVNQYPSRHLHPGDSGSASPLPTFEVADWTTEKTQSYGLKLSQWRTRLKKPQDHGRAEPPTAITVILRNTALQSFSQRNLSGSETDIQVVPIHVFLDLGKAIMIDEVIAFLHEASPRHTSQSYTIDEPDDDSWSDSEDAETPPASPSAWRTLGKENKMDIQTTTPDTLMLGVDHPDNFPVRKEGKGKAHAQGKSTNTMTVRLEMIRVQVRSPPPLDRLPRSGALVFDLHGVKMKTTPWPRQQHMARFTDDALVHVPDTSKFVFGMEIQRILIACCPVSGRTAISIFSSGAIDARSDEQFSHSDRTSHAAPLQPRLFVTKQASSSYVRPVITALNVVLPSVHVDVSKAVLDSLQYLADDISQLIERTLNPDGYCDSNNDGNLIGSRFFAKSRSASTITTEGTRRSETVIKITISGAFVRAMVPSMKDDSVYPLIISAADVDVLLEMKPEGKDETVLTIGIVDLEIQRIPTLHSTEILLSLTAPRGLSSVPRTMFKLRFITLVVPETTAKESKVKLTLWGFTFTLLPNIDWISDLGAFTKSPPGAFESVIPNERTSIHLKIHDGSLHAFAPQHPGSMVAHIGELDFFTNLVGNSSEFSFIFSVPTLSFFVVDEHFNTENSANPNANHDVVLWKDRGFAVVADIADLSLNFKQTSSPDAKSTDVEINRVALSFHMCADTLAAVTTLAADIGSIFAQPHEHIRSPQKRPTIVSSAQQNRGLMESVDDLAFRRVPEIGPAPDMIHDHLPTNMDYLDESFGAAAGLRELDDDEFDIDEVPSNMSVDVTADGTGITSRVGGETVKMLRSTGIQVIEDYFGTLPPETGVQSDKIGETEFRLRLADADITLLLYDGYDWLKTRRVIENEVREMRRRLTKIRQLVATGQVSDSNNEETSTLLFNSVYIGLDRDLDGMEPGAILAAIDDQLRDDFETASQSSWQSLQPPTHSKARTESVRVHGKRLTRSKASSMEFRFVGLKAEVDNYRPDEAMVARTLVTIQDVEILDHIKTSTWKKFLTELRSDSRGNIRETGSNMVRVELCHVHPVPGYPSQEARLRMKILPLRLYVDQDALDFLKKFFSFTDPDAPPPDPNAEEIYFQLAEVFPVDLKLDYKPRRVDYRALREGRTIELMNFFHFDGAEMTLRHITLNGITGWARLFELLNDLWTPDVKATQLVDVISGVAPIRSMVNVGSGVADLVLLPIAQYKKDGRIVRGVQKGTTAFVKSTATEAIKLGARLATGTQVILEQAEGVLGGQFQHAITAETFQAAVGDELPHGGDEDESVDISKYAQQPVDLKEGIQSAYQSLRKNLTSAAQTILAVPMEVYERSENEGAVRAVIRAVPIAVLKPMIGASEAVSKTLLGLHNTLDPDVRHDNEAKYKRR